MIYSAIGLAVIGAVVGLAFRWKVLLPVIVLLPVAAIIFSVSHGLSNGHTAIVVIVAEAILQGGYFAGLLMRLVSSRSMRSAGAKSFFKSRRDPGAGGEDRHAAPPAEAGKGS
jgi:hypothetical protein